MVPLVVWIGLLSCVCISCAFITPDQGRKMHLRCEMGVYGKGQKVKGNSEKVATIVNVEDIYADLWRVDEVVSLLKNGALGVIPTDTCYSFVASLSHANAVDRLLRLKGGSGHKKPLSVLCKDLSQISEYTEQFNAKWVYKLLKATLPGPFTFILPASKAVPKIVMSDKIHPKRWRRKEIGIRLPDDPIYEAIIGQLDEPLLCGSVPGQPEDWSEINLALRARENEGDNSDDDDRMDVSSQQDDMSREEITMAYPWTNQVDFIVEAGYRGTAGPLAGLSTVVDLTGGQVVVLRNGIGELPDIGPSLS